MNRLKNNSYPWERGFIFVALMAGAYSLYMAVRYASQLPLDLHDFKQNHNALIIYWFIKNGFSLVYEAPVMGRPWVIPMEFPIYNYIVTAISMTFNTPIHTTGRIVSYAFLLGCFIPSRSIMNKLDINKNTFYIFVALVLSTPVYLYWSRTVMTETTVLFLTLCAMKYFVDGMINGIKIKNIMLFSVFITLALLQKALTPAVFLGVASIIYFFHEAGKHENKRDIAWTRIVKVGIICFLIPLVISYSWIAYTDRIKLAGVASYWLTIGNHGMWYFGSPQMWLSETFFNTLVWQRIVIDNLNGTLGLFLILLLFFKLESTVLKVTALAALGLAILPLIFFTNVHVRHDYYQVANIIYALFLMALSLSHVILPTIGIKGTLLIITLLVSFNLHSFSNHEYSEQVQKEFDKGNNRRYAIGAILKRELPDDGQFIAFGDDWNPSITYMSERKSFTAKNDRSKFKEYPTALNNPEHFLDPGKFRAAVSCLQDSLHVSSMLEIAAKNSWKIGQTHGCLIAVPQQSFPTTMPEPVQCRGYIDEAENVFRDGMSLVSFVGWSSMRGDEIEFPDTAYFIVSDSKNIIQRVEALRVPRLDVNEALSVDRDIDTGLSAVIPTNMPTGEYSVGILQVKGEISEFCHYNKHLKVR